MTEPDPTPRDLSRASDEDVSELVQLLYEGVGPAVLSLGHRYFGSRRDLAEELVAETFARVLLGIRRFQGRAAYRTWIFRIAMNVAARWLRDMKRHGTEPLQEEPGEDRPDPLVEKERRDSVNRAVRALSPEHRMVLALVVQDDLSQNDIAELLGVGPGTVWSRYARARLALARKLEDLND